MSLCSPVLYEDYPIQTPTAPGCRRPPCAIRLFRITWWDTCISGSSGGRQGPVGVSEAQAAELNVLNPTLFCEVALQHQQLFEPRRDHHGLARLLTGFRNVSQLAKRSVQIPLAWLMPRARCPPGSDGPWQALPNSGR